MAAPIDLRSDFDSVSLRRLAKTDQGRRSEPSAAGVPRSYDGRSQRRMRRARRDVGPEPSPPPCWLQRHADRMGWSMGTSPGSVPRTCSVRRIASAHMAWKRSETGPIPAVNRTYRRRCAGGARTWLGWPSVRQRFRVDETSTCRRAHVGNPRLGRQDLGHRPYSAKRAGRRRFENNQDTSRTGRNPGAGSPSAPDQGVEIEFCWHQMLPASARRRSWEARRWARRAHAPAGAKLTSALWAYTSARSCLREGERRPRWFPLVRHRPWRRTGTSPEAVAAVDPGRSISVPIVDQAGRHLTPKLAILDNNRPGAAATIARVEPGGECLAIHARQLVVEPDLQILRRHRRAVCGASNNLIDQTLELGPRHAQMAAHGF